LYLNGSKARRVPIPFIGLILVVIIGLGILWRQRSRLPAEIVRTLPQAVIVNPLATNTPPASQIKLVRSIVVTPVSDAFTADFYLDEFETHASPAWAGINGRSDIETYVVQPGDTLWSIAAQFSLDVDTLRWSNPDVERNPDLLSVNTELRILPVVGLYHTVVEGDTLTSIAEQYGVADVDIFNYPLNKLNATSKLNPGSGLIVPHGRKEFFIPAPDLDLDYLLAWPLVGRVTQGYRPDHLALDIGAPYSSDVYAADSGTVILARWARTGYGYTILIDHGQGRQTLYSHLKGALAKTGHIVERGQVIGQVGSTGNSSGPHVHFEVREGGQHINPLDYLK